VELGHSWMTLGVAAVAMAGLAGLASVLVSVPLRILVRRANWDDAQARRIERRVAIFLFTLALALAGRLFAPDTIDESVVDTIRQFFRLVLIAELGWLLAGVAGLLFAQAVRRYPMDVADNRVARRVRTQVTIIRRLTSVLIALVTVGAMLLTFPGVQALGASLLASAGLVGVVAGVAAQSTLAGLFAGLQLAFSDAIRVDDVVVVNGEWGRIEEITLTYVVLRIWDDRRLVLPSTYFTTNPFENWTRRDSALVGSVELDLDWRVSPAAVRGELERILADHALWDGRSWNVQVTDATGGLVRVRVLVSAADSGALWDLRCSVRERLVEWVRVHAPDALPLQRLQLQAKGTEGVGVTGDPV